MALARRTIQYLALAAAAVVVLAMTAAFVLTRTAPGVERAGRFLLGRLDRSIQGSISVSDIGSPGLLHGVMLRGVEIVDENGRPFVRADSARLGYRLSSLIRGAVVFDRLEVFGPEVTIERLPGDERWNYDRVFADASPGPEPPDTTTGSAPSRGEILIQRATIHDGRVVIRIPWEGGDPDSSRVIVESVPGGQVRTLRFEDVQARLPRVVWEAPDTGRVFEVERLATRAFIFDAPVQVDDLRGVVTLQDSVVGFDAERVRLPDSELSVQGQVVVGDEENRYDVDATSDRVALRDFHWLYPPLPEDGGGSLRFRIETQPSGEVRFLATDADLSTEGTALAGSFGVVTGEPLRFTDVDVRATPLDLELLARLLPDAPAMSGLVMGSIRAEGPTNDLWSQADVRYRTFDADGNGAESSLRWNGVLGWDAPYVLRDMEAELLSVDLAQVAQFAPALRLRGSVQGTLRGTGSLEDGVQVRGDIALTQGGELSAIEGSGRFALGGTPTFDLQLDAQPVALDLLAQQVPAFEGLRGEARGPVTVAGSLDDLLIGVDLMTPAGALVMQGSLGLTGPRPTYRAEGSVTEFRLDRVASDLPETVVTGRFEVDGSAFELASLDGRASVDVLAARVGGVEVYHGAFRGGVSDGVARVDSLSVTTEVGDAEAQGTFGLLEGRDGELDVTVRADSLVFLEPLLFENQPIMDLGLEQSARIDGLLTVDGRLTGSLAAWRASGTARARSLLYDQLELGRGRVDVAWQQDTLTVDASLDSLRYGGRRLATARGAMTYAHGRGVVNASIQGRRRQQLDVESAFEPQGGVVDLAVRQLQLSTRDGQWTLADTVSASVGAEGLRVDSMVLVRQPARARIRVAGVLPWRPAEADEVQVASLDVELDSVRIGEFLRVTQTDTLVDGTVNGRFRVTGTATAPQLQGRVDARAFRYDGAVLDSVRAEVAYRNELVQGDFSGWRADEAIITGDARVPLRLALTEVEERLLDEPMRVEFVANGVPAGLLSFLTPGFSDLEGRIQGRFALEGTTAEPDLRGTLELADGGAYYQPLGVRYRNVQATARMTEGSAVELDATLATDGGRGEIRGTLDLTRPGDPAFDLQLVARRLDATHRRDVSAVISGEAELTGRYTRPVVSGDVQILRGEMNLDEIWRQHQIIQLDTTLFQLMDTTQVSYRPQPESPFLGNLVVTNTTVSTDRNFWLRSQELNVEVGGELSLEVDRMTEDFRLTGELQVLEGSYYLLARRVPGGRRFEIRDGTIEFVGTPGIDPNLSIEAAYRVRRAQGEPINVIASVTGTLQDPRVTLSSDAEIPMSETELASYILFGRSGAELTQAELDVASGGALAVGALVRPVVSGVASSEIQQAVSNLGLPINYVSLSLPEYDFAQYGAAWENYGGALGLFQNAQLEVGFDLTRSVSVISSVRIPGGEGQEDLPTALRLFGARIEYRPWRTWTIEGYIEDQFARTPSFGPAEINDRKVLGLSLFREWGY